MELASYITSSSLENNESKILLVESAIQEQKWEKARKDIRSLLDVEPSREVCLLMAKIEDGDSQDIQKVNSWTLRSERGEAKDIWICSVIQSQTASTQSRLFKRSKMPSHPIIIKSKLS